MGNKIKAKEISLNRELNIIESIAQFVDNIIFLDISILVSLTMKLTDADSTPFEVENTKDEKNGEKEIDFIMAFEAWTLDGTFKKAKRAIGRKKYDRLDSMIRVRYAELSNSISKMMPTMEELERLSEAAKEGGIIAKN